MVVQQRIRRLPKRLARAAADLLILRRYWRDRAAIPLCAAHKQLYFIISRYHRSTVGRFPNLSAPVTYNDKVAWLLLFAQSAEMIRCSDKVAVRDYVAERVGSKYLNTLYGVFDTCDDIDVSVLPSAFVVKANNDSGTVFLVRNKCSADWDEIRRAVDAALRRRFGWRKGEWYYSFIRPRVLVERHLTPDDAVPPPDYKFHCVDGKVSFVQFIFDRGVGTKEVIFDRQWTRMPLHLDENFQSGAQKVTPPDSLGEMIEVAEALADGFRYVRVDLYNVDGAIVFGEMTFAPMSGCYTSADIGRFGALLNFDMTAVDVPVYNNPSVCSRYDCSAAS